MKPILIALVLLVAIVTATAIRYKHERRPINDFNKVIIKLGVLAAAFIF